MAKGVSAKFVSYEETLPKVLSLIKFDQELKKYDSIVIKPSLKNLFSHNTSASCVESLLNFCLQHKSPQAKVYIAEGSDGDETLEVFDAFNYKKIAEKYNVSLIDLNTAESELIQKPSFLKFESINYPKILLNSYVISLPRLFPDAETEMQGALANMLGAFPSMYYQGFFNPKKTKIRKWPIKYSIHDIVQCKMPNLAIIDASDYGKIFIGNPLEMDKQASNLIGKDWKAISHLKIIEETFQKEQMQALARASAKEEKKEEQQDF